MYLIIQLRFFSKAFQILKTFKYLLIQRKYFSNEIYSLVFICAHSGTQAGYELQAENAKIVENKNAVKIFLGIILSLILL